MTQANAEAPELIWTTVPPAKSNAPRLRTHPPTAHTQSASGSYMNVAHSKVKIRKLLNYIRSANAPVMRAGVITANII